MRPNPPIKGHELIDEGHVRPLHDYPDGAWKPIVIGHRGGCRCGAKPPGFPNLSQRAMKAWHRAHKDEVRLAQVREARARGAARAHAAGELTYDIIPEAHQ